MKQIKQSERFQSLWKRYKYVALVVLVGVILLALPNGSGQSGEKTAAVQEPAAEEETLDETESKMETILSQIKGAGALKLMLTVDNGAEKQLAQDQELSYSGATSAPDTYTRKSETVIISGDTGDAPVVTAVSGPVYRGALVVCEGGGEPGVKLAITQAVAALTGLSTDRITVVQCQ